MNDERISEFETFLLAISDNHTLTLCNVYGEVNQPHSIVRMSEMSEVYCALDIKPIELIEILSKDVYSSISTVEPKENNITFQHIGNISATQLMAMDENHPGIAEAIVNWYARIDKTIPERGSKIPRDKFESTEDELIRVFGSQIGRILAQVPQHLHGQIIRHALLEAKRQLSED